MITPQPLSCRLYLITPPRPEDPAALARLLDEALGAGDVGAVQIRFKGEVDPESGAETPASDAYIRQHAPVLIAIARTRGVAAILNDRPDLARELGADGVHVGQSDASYEAARAEMGPDAIIGVTCHASRHLAIEAADAGADYVAFGAFYPTTTKTPSTQADPEIVEWWSELFTTPCVAIGGVTHENAAPLVQAGADFLAASSGVWDHPEGPAAGVRAFNAAIKSALAE